MALSLPSTTKRKKRVLTEEEYVSAIEAIIERDFFPDIPLLKQKLAFMNSQATQWQQVGELFTVAAPLSSIAGKYPTTPALKQGQAFIPETPLVVGVSMDDAVKEEAPDDGQPIPAAPLDVFLSRFTSEDNASFGELQEETLHRKRLKVHHLLEYPKPDTGEHQTYIDWKFTPKNQLFYDASVTGDVPYTESELTARVQGPPKELRHENTRFPVPFDMKLEKGMKPGVDYHLPGVGVVDKAQRTLLSTPMPEPGKNVTPIMTWGELAATPVRLDRTPGFTIKAASERDLVGRKMASHARRSLLRKSARMTPTAVRSTPKSLSEAGKKLAATLRTPGTDRQLRASYARTPSRLKTASGATPATPVRHKPMKKEVKTEEPFGSITDNLLDRML